MYTVREVLDGNIALNSDNNEKNPAIFDDESWHVDFSSEKNVFSASPKHHKKRINALDTQLMEKTSESEDFMPAAKLDTLRTELEKIDKQIEYAKMTDNKLLIKDLYIERYRIAHEMDAINTNYEGYNAESMLRKFMRGFAVVIKVMVNVKKSFISYLHKIRSKMSSNIAKTSKLQEVVNTLDGLNQSVDELSNLSIPYGEQETRYEELTKYLSQANSINGKLKMENGK